MLNHASLYPGTTMHNANLFFNPNLQKAYDKIVRLAFLSLSKTTKLRTNLKNKDIQTGREHWEPLLLLSLQADFLSFGFFWPDYSAHTPHPLTQLPAGLLNLPATATLKHPVCMCVCVCFACSLQQPMYWEEKREGGRKGGRRMCG